LGLNPGLTTKIIGRTANTLQSIANVERAIKLLQ